MISSTGWPQENRIFRFLNIHNKIAFNPNRKFFFADVHYMKYRIRWENKNFDDMGTFLIIIWGKVFETNTMKWMVDLLQGFCSFKVIKSWGSYGFPIIWELLDMGCLLYPQYVLIRSKITVKMFIAIICSLFLDVICCFRKCYNFV